MAAGNLIDDVFTEDEMKVLYMFVDSGNRRKCYTSVLGKETNTKIYRWFKKPEVLAKIVEIGQELAVYDTVCDKVLLSIVTDTTAADRDKISAIKTWNDLRSRVHTTIKIESETKLDLSNVTTENLGVLVDAIMKGTNESRTEDTTD